MFKVDTPEGERYLVQLVGPKSYRMGGQITYRGGTLTVTKRTRDYLVRSTKGAWADFDPEPVEEVQEVLPPQFGEPGGPMIDMGDIDPQKNPPMSMDHARQLAAKSGALSGGPSDPGPDPDDLQQAATAPAPAQDEAGDMTSADLKGKTGGSGGAGASKKPGNVKVTGSPASAKTGAVKVE